MNVLHIFDFDDTLIKSESSVKITHSNNKTSTMSSEEYAKYKERPGDVFDFSEFDTYPIGAEIIEPVFNQLKNSIEKDGVDSTIILTARSNPKPVLKFLNDNGIFGIKVVAVGSSNPLDKAMYVMSRVKDDNVGLVRVFEDNVKNIREIRKMLVDGKTKLQTHRIKNGKIVRA